MRKATARVVQGIRKLVQGNGDMEAIVRENGGSMEDAIGG